MLNFELINGNYKIQIGEAQPQGKVNPMCLQTGLIFKFKADDIRNFDALRAKIKTLQKLADNMEPEKLAAFRAEVSAAEALATSVFEKVFSPDDYPEEFRVSTRTPTIQEAREIINKPVGEVTHPALLLMYNAAVSRNKVLERGINSEQDFKDTQGDLYRGVNEAKGLTSKFQAGHVVTGNYKENMNAMGENKTPTPALTPKFMADLVEWMNSDEIKQMNPLLAAIVTHYMFVQIHPFEDGNGRTSRELYESLLKNLGDGSYDLKGLVSITECYDKPALIQLYGYMVPKQFSGEIDLTNFIGAVAGFLEKSVDIAFERAGVELPGKDFLKSAARVA